MFYKIAGVSLAAILFLAACGGTDDNNNIDFDATVVYKSAGSYDLRDYFAPSVNSINIYDHLLYINNDGRKSFSSDPDERSTYSEKYDINGSKIIIRNGNDTIEEIYDIQEDRLVVLDDQNTVQMQLPRYVDIDDYVYVDRENDSSNNIPTVKQIACKVINHYNSKEINAKTYDDVLEVLCESQENGDSQGDIVSLTYEGESTETIFFAKGKGEVYSEEVGCDTLKSILNGQEQTQSTCTKEISDLISSNTL